MNEHTLVLICDTDRKVVLCSDETLKLLKVLDDLGAIPELTWFLTDEPDDDVT